MFIAGLSVAQAVQKSFDIEKSPNVLICVGPGKVKIMRVYWVKNKKLKRLPE
jgi:hypothetical protein